MANIPERFLRVAAKWYDDKDDLLYAVSSAGGLYGGVARPLDNDGCYMTDEEWGIYLWETLSVDVGYAADRVKCVLQDCSSNDFDEILEDYVDMVDFERWIDETVLPYLKSNDA